MSSFDGIRVSCRVDSLCIRFVFSMVRPHYAYTPSSSSSATSSNNTSPILIGVAATVVLLFVACLVYYGASSSATATPITPRSAMSGHKVGGKGAASDADDATQQLVTSLRADILSKAGLTDSDVAEFTAVSQRTQVVAGINRFIKVAIGNGQYIHVTIWDKLDHTHVVTAVTAGKTLEDPL